MTAAREQLRELGGNWSNRGTSSGFGRAHSLAALDESLWTLEKPRKTRPLTEDEADSISELCNLARQEVRVLNIDPAKEIAEAIFARVYEIQKEGRAFDPDERYSELAYQIGALWGTLFVNELGWEWLFLETSDGAAAYIVASPDRAMMIYPIDFVDICLKKRDVDITVALAFNMVAEGAAPDLPPDGYVNVMAHIKHIVPYE